MGKRQKIIAEIERALARIENRPGLCLYYAHHVARILWQHKCPAVIQAGSLQWPRVRREEDDGVLDTHFSYMWTPGAADSALSVALGNLPEMHVWVGILDQQEIVDFTTRHLVAAANEHGLAWTSPAPPRYLWCPAINLPDWVVYRPYREATLFACAALKRLFNPEYLHKAAK